MVNRFSYVLVLGLIMIVISACGVDVDAVKQKVEKQVEETLNNKINELVNQEATKFSSNPMEYIKNHQDLYNELVKESNGSIEYFVNEIKNSKENGLKEWILAKAAQDILGKQGIKEEWATGKEWLEKYEQLNKQP
ncbi:hypothetical protein BHU72_10815 [Desulfuribacillus stibiiarsenatis]|uniref:Lipoprotein n=1 Tax=Desulfuribacillus stibiiarsenatis TaxID=1390249 RepID=A0A1E5L2E1_9FIRM|nr:hypothetical protein [Desulfuribacillus stibiiarsenatis]OEH84297.1 hypothetical protein BHU72_10815 [Desulfuribacillus stibiiarsenatis]